MSQVIPFTGQALQAFQYVREEAQLVIVSITVPTPNPGVLSSPSLFACYYLCFPVSPFPLPVTTTVVQAFIVGCKTFPPSGVLF